VPAFRAMDAENAFREAMRAHGLVPPADLIADGRIHRCDADRKHGKLDGWYVLHLDGVPRGSFGDWGDGEGSHSWCARDLRDLSPEERTVHHASMEADRKRREAEDAQRRAEAARKARSLWQAAQPAAADHPYLKRKGIAPVTTLREIDQRAAADVLGYEPQSKGELLTGRLLVAPVKVNNELATVEMIDEAGRKSAIKDGAKREGFWAAQQLPDGSGDGVTLLVGEGVATVISSTEATGYLGVAALSCGNLLAVARKLRNRYPAARAVLLADIGIGEEKAAEAAQAVGGSVALPAFGEARPDGATDFNDLHQAQGLEAVCACIDAAATPAKALSSDASHRLQADGERDWPEPEPLLDALPPVPALDDRLLPESLRPWLADIAERLQCPPEYAATGALVALSSIVGRGCAIRPKSKDDWTVVPNLWGAIVGPPSAMKTPALSESLRPVGRLIAKATEEHDQEMESYDAELAEAAARRTVIKDQMKEAAKKDQDMTALRAKYTEATDPDEPTERRYIVNDATVEKLGELLNENPRGLLHYRDELTGWLATLDREGHENDRKFFLEAWNGDGQYTYDRIGRGTLHINAVCVSMLGGIQPGPLAEYLRSAMRGGLGDDGLIQRFQVLMYPDPPRDWRNVDEWPDSAARDRAFETFQRLDVLSPTVLGITVEDLCLPFLRFDGAAQELFDRWRGDLMRRLRSGDEHPAFESHLAKYPSLMPSLALIFHLADAATMPPGPVTLMAAQRAAAWCDLLEAHAKRMYHTATTQDMKAARAILAKLKARKLSSPFTERTVYRAGWTGLAEPDLVKQAIKVLIDYGWLRESVRDTGGHPRREYHAHPSLPTGSTP
jgi:putative DNA primase/helicase